MNNATKLGMLVSLLLATLGHAKQFKVVNCGAATDEQMTEIIQFCDAQLPFDLTLESNNTFDCQDPAGTLASAKKLKTENDAAVIVLVDCESFKEHQLLDTAAMVAVVNVKDLKIGDAKKYEWRQERMILRSVASLFGIKPAPDPYCVTRDYSSLVDFDSMGRNFTPPYNLQIERKATVLQIDAKQHVLPFGVTP